MRYTTLFFLNKRNKDDTSARLRCMVKWDGCKFVFDVGYNVNVADWNNETQSCKARTFHGRMRIPAAEINRAIADSSDLVSAIFEHFGDIPTKEQFKHRYEVITGKAKGDTEGNIFSVYDKFVADGRRLGRWRSSTMKKIEIVRKHLAGISKSLTFDDLNESGMQKVIAYLSTLKGKNGAAGLSNPTINKEISVIKAFLRWAAENGYCEPNKMVSMRSRLKSARKTIVYLKWEELMRLYNHDFGAMTHLSQVRDVFCFCCFTSLRYSDVSNLRRSDIGEDSFTVTTVKTDDRLVIELNKYSKAILDKYADKVFKGDRALPVISNQKMNDYIKEAARLCEIDEPVTITRYQGTVRTDEEFKKYEVLSTHAGRRTFVCNALMLGIPPAVVMKWTGHSDYKAMLPYIDIADEAKRKAMAAFDKQ